MAVKHLEKLVIGSEFPKDHPDIVLEADKEEEIAWKCESHKLKIKIRKEGPKIKGVPNNPFQKPFPLETEAGKEISSGKPKVTAKGYRYKYTAQALNPDNSDKQVWDPHIIIK